MKISKNNLIIILSALGLYFLSAGLSFFIFSQTLNKNIVSSPLPVPTVGNNGQLTFDKSLPKTQVCPLNGVLYSKQQEAWWQKHRPLGVMIENHREARPQSGLSGADVIYEAVAEGGITRFLAMFYCQDGGQVGPVRSARTYYVDFASEYADYPLYAHVGGANQPGPADALSQLDDYGWTGYNDLNQFSIGFPTFWRDYDRLGRTVATEHTMYSTVSKLWEYGATTRKLTNVNEDGKSWDANFVQYKFIDDAPTAATSSLQTMHLEFWKGGDEYFVNWVYDPKTNTYKRSNGGKPHLDRDTNKQIAAKNVVVLYMRELNANDGYENNVHLLYKNKGMGKAVVFKDGKQIVGTWKKASRTARTMLMDSTGKEIQFNRGLIWFTVLPIDGVLTVK